MSGIHLRERNLIFDIKNLILVNIIEKSQKMLDLKAKGMGGGDVTKAEIKIMMPPKQLKPADIRNGKRPAKGGEHWFRIWTFFLLGEKHLLAG